MTALRAAIARPAGRTRGAARRRRARSGLMRRRASSPPSCRMNPPSDGT